MNPTTVGILVGGGLAISGIVIGMMIAVMGRTPFTKLSPLAEWERARASLALQRRALADLHAHDPGTVGALALIVFVETQIVAASRKLRAARIRLALSALAFLTVASVVMLIVWGLTVLLIAAGAPTPADQGIQLPTL